MRRKEKSRARLGLRTVAGLAVACWLALEPGLAGFFFHGGSGNAAYAGDGGTEVYGQLLSGAKVEGEKEYAEPAVPTVYLTFDDGPSKLTGQVLDVLKREQVPSTFFVVGELAEERKELVKRMAEEGHAVGNHTYNHVYKELYRDFASFREQAERTDRVLESITGRKPFLLRAPGGTAGNFDPFYFFLLEQAGYSVMDWNVDSRDAVRKNVQAADIVEEIRRSPLKRELVVLMHDGAGHEETVKALPEIIAYYREKGYAFAALHEQVKPVQFRLSPVKWSRSYTAEGFRAAWTEAEASFADRGTQAAEDRKSERRLAERVAQASAEAAEALERRAAEADAGSLRAGVPLRIGMGDGGPVWSLQPGQYGFEHNRFAVPLRALAEQAGAKVSWDEAKRLATVDCGFLRLEVDPARRTVRELRTGRPAVTRYLADVVWTDGEIRVPLRSAAGLFGGQVADYALEERESRVELAFGPERGRVAWLPAVIDWKRGFFSQSHV